MLVFCLSARRKTSAHLTAALLFALCRGINADGGRCDHAPQARDVACSDKESTLQHRNLIDDAGHAGLERLNAASGTDTPPASGDSASKVILTPWDQYGIGTPSSASSGLQARETTSSPPPLAQRTRREVMYLEVEQQWRRLIARSTMRSQLQPDRWVQDYTERSTLNFLLSGQHQAIRESRAMDAEVLHTRFRDNGPNGWYLVMSPIRSEGLPLALLQHTIGRIMGTHPYYQFGAFDTHFFDETDVDPVLQIQGAVLHHEPGVLLGSMIVRQNQSLVPRVEANLRNPLILRNPLASNSGNEPANPFEDRGRPRPPPPVPSGAIPTRAGNESTTPLRSTSSPTAISQNSASPSATPANVDRPTSANESSSDEVWDPEGGLDPEFGTPTRTQDIWQPFSTLTVDPAHDPFSDGNSSTSGTPVSPGSSEHNPFSDGDGSASEPRSSDAPGPSGLPSPPPLFYNVHDEL